MAMMGGGEAGCAPSFTVKAFSASWMNERDPNSESLKPDGQGWFSIVNFLHSGLSVRFASFSELRLHLIACWGRNWQMRFKYFLVGRNSNKYASAGRNVRCVTPDESVQPRAVVDARQVGILQIVGC